MPCQAMSLRHAAAYAVFDTEAEVVKAARCSAGSAAALKIQAQAKVASSEAQ